MHRSNNRAEIAQSMQKGFNMGQTLYKNEGRPGNQTKVSVSKGYFVLKDYCQHF